MPYPKSGLLGEPQQTGLMGTMPMSPLVPNRPVLWKAEYMKQTGRNPDIDGVTEGDWLRMQMKQRRIETAPVPMPGNWSGGVRG